jgi:anti-anti-sigma factor
MRISVEERSHVTVVSLAGSIDALTADAITAALGAQVSAGNTRLVAELAGVDYTSSAGLRILLATVKAARHLGGDLRLAAAGDRVRGVLELSGFTQILKCYPDVDAAVDSYTA